MRLEIEHENTSRTVDYIQYISSTNSLPLDLTGIRLIPKCSQERHNIHAVAPLMIDDTRGGRGWYFQLGCKIKQTTVSILNLVFIMPFCEAKKSAKPLHKTAKMVTIT